jgi:hypothetical protein
VEQSITNAVDGYAAAVRAKDVDAFVAFYDADFETSEGRPEALIAVGRVESPACGG